MLIVPLQSVPNQTLGIVLGNQSCRLTLTTRSTGLFMDVMVNDDPIVLGVICQNLNRIVRALYLGFTGDFVFQDQQGTDDPVYTGLGSRFLLYYLSPSEVTAGTA